jgi:hypothetical protein
MKGLATVLAIVLFGGSALASDSASSRARNVIKPRPQERQTGVREDDFVGFVSVIPQRPLHERLIEIAICAPAPAMRYLQQKWVEARFELFP